jgi:hypothetical protein
MLVHSISLDTLRRGGLYNRPTDNFEGQLWDVLSDAPMSTEFAISRFLTPILARQGWALFTDCDMLVRKDIEGLLNLADDKYAVMCVKHRHHVPEGSLKQFGNLQVNYSCKNWSSVMLFNCDHPANQALTVEMINTLPGRDLHRFCWLEDDYIGALPPEWNWLVGISPPIDDPAIVHFTEGTPDIVGYENTAFAEEWRTELERVHGRSRRTA